MHFKDSLVYNNCTLYYKLFDNSLEAKQELNISTEFNSNVVIVEKNVKLNKDKLNKIFDSSKYNKDIRIEIVLFDKIEKKYINDVLILIINEYEIYINKLSLLVFKKGYSDLTLESKKELISKNELYIYVYDSNIMVPPNPPSSKGNIKD